MRPTNPNRIEVVDDAMADVLRKMSGAQRLRITSGMFTSARRWINSAVMTAHPDWSGEQVRAEVVRRLSHGTITTPSPCGGST